MSPNLFASVRPDGGKFDKLLFLTDKARLIGDIGTVAADLISHLEMLGCTIVDGTGFDDIRAKAPRRLDDFEGCVILGGPDVVPQKRMTTLTAVERLNPGLVQFDPDEFFVWSDDDYASRSYANIAEIPVSRVPTNGNGTILEAAFAVRPNPIKGHCCLYNWQRGYAERISMRSFPNGRIEPSEPFTEASHRVPGTPGVCDGDTLYVVLHGSHLDGSTQWGEDAAGLPIRTWSVSDIPASFSGMVFNSSCYGGLTAAPRAVAAGSAPSSGVGTGDSIALAFLAAGARGYVACTGVHFSLDVPEGMHLHAQFWNNVANYGFPPAKALHLAKRDTIRNMAGNDQMLQWLAIKNAHQTTCLGLGW